MESKWPFMLIVFGLLFALGFAIASLEKKTVMDNWDQRRCNLPVIAAAMFFKPDSDPRTKTQFAQDNFDFCMKSVVEKFMAILMAPINALMESMMGVATKSADSTSSLRGIAAKLYSVFSSYIDQYLRRFNAATYEVSRIIQYLRMAMRRANGVVMSMLYSGLTLFRGMINMIQFVIKVVLIICGIMLAIIIILIFILFPFIPLILSVLGGIIATVLAMSMVMAGSIASEADGDRSGFCFSSWTLIPTIDEEGKEVIKSVTQIKIGDELAQGCGKVTAVIQMDGRDIPLYHLNGIIVSGSHLVKGTDGEWRSVSQDKRAIETNVESPILYCFNTTTHTIPVYYRNEVTIFRDWEEIAEDDERGQYEWNYIVLKMLNKVSNYNTWKDSLTITENIPLLSSNIKVKTQAGFLPIDSMFIGLKYILDSKGNKQEVLGIVRGQVDSVDPQKTKELGEWNTELYEFENDVWVKGKSTVVPGNDRIEGMTIITESGEFVIWDEVEKRERVIRDFTEVGYKTIHETYPFVASRLRTR
jgi:hypothetical protein